MIIHSRLQAKVEKTNTIIILLAPGVRINLENQLLNAIDKERTDFLL